MEKEGKMQTYLVQLRGDDRIALAGRYYFLPSAPSTFFFFFCFLSVLDPSALSLLLSSEKLFKCSVFLNSLYSLSVYFCFCRFKASIGKGKVHFWYGVLKKT